MVKNPPVDARDMDLVPGSQRSPGAENGNPLQYSFLGNPIDRGAWQVTIHGLVKELDTTERLHTQCLSPSSNLPTRCTWVWVNSRSWWWTGRPGMLRFMESQRVGHDWAAELNWTEQRPTSESAASFTWIWSLVYPENYILWTEEHLENQKIQLLESICCLSYYKKQNLVF